MKKLTNPKAYGLPNCETYYSLDGFVFQEVKHSEVIDLINMGKSVYELFDDNSESLIDFNSEINKNSVYGIEVGDESDLFSEKMFSKINKNLGLNK